MNSNEIVETAQTLAEKFPTILEDFNGMLSEYKACVEALGLNPEEDLPATKHFLLQVVGIIEALQAVGEANG